MSEKAATEVRYLREVSPERLEQWRSQAEVRAGEFEFSLGHISQPDSPDHRILSLITRIEQEQQWAKTFEEEFVKEERLRESETARCVEQQATIEDVTIELMEAYDTIERLSKRLKLTTQEPMDFALQIEAKNDTIATLEGKLERARNLLQRWDDMTVHPPEMTMKLAARQLRAALETEVE